MIDNDILAKLSKRNAEHQAERDAVKGDNMTFVIEPYEQKQINEWLAEHNKTCSLRWHEDGTPVEFPGGAIGGGLTYEFTPNGIGMATSVSCHCGAECNVTDYDLW